MGFEAKEYDDDDDGLEEEEGGIPLSLWAAPFGPLFSLGLSPDSKRGGGTPSPSRCPLFSSLKCVCVGAVRNLKTRQEAESRSRPPASAAEGSS